MEIPTVKAVFGVLSSAAVFIAFIPYLRGIRKNKIHPHVLSWTGWGFVTALASFAMLSEGFTWGVAVVAANSALCFIVSIFSIVKKVGVWKTGWYDQLFFILGITGLILWQIFDNPDIAISFAIVADLSFGLPTLIKIYKFPKSETAFPWFFFAFSGVSSLVAVSYISFTEVAYPAYLALYDTLAFLLILFPRFGSYKKPDKKILKEILTQAWSKETCYEPQQREWSEENPAQGQCYVTVLVLNDYLGGEILKAKSSNGVSHYWNRIEDEEVDLTRSQFGEDEVFTEPMVVSREDLEENDRYRLLKQKVQELLNLNL